MKSIREIHKIGKGPFSSHTIGSEIWDFLMDIWQTTKRSIAYSLSATGVLPGGLGVQRKAECLREQTLPTDAAANRCHDFGKRIS